MKVEAIQAFTAFTGEMVVFNAGDVRDLPDAVAKQYIEAGLAKKSGKSVTQVADAVDAANEAPVADVPPAAEPEAESEAAPV